MNVYKYFSYVSAILFFVAEYGNLLYILYLLKICLLEN